MTEKIDNVSTTQESTTNSEKDPYEVACLKDDLTEAARLVECSTLMLSDMVRYYFEAYDSSKTKDRAFIVYDYNRYRLFASMCLDMLTKIKQELHEHGIYCYLD